MKSIVRLLPHLPLLLLLACQSSMGDSQSESFESLVEAERAFAHTSVTSGTRAAFLEYFAADGIVFDAGPVNAHEVWEQRPAEGPKLAWGPEIADVSQDGDLGYTSGPYEVSATPDSDPVVWGHFVSVWRKNTDGIWEVVADGGVAHGPASLGQDSIVTRLGVGETFTPPASDADIGAIRAALVDTDESYSQSVVERGFHGSLDEYVSPSARFYRNGQLPLVGQAALTDSALGTALVWESGENRGTILATSGDLGSTYGILNPDAEADPSATRGDVSYYRIWKRQGDAEWRVVVDVLVPIPPSSE